MQQLNFFVLPEFRKNPSRIDKIGIKYSSGQPDKQSISSSCPENKYFFIDFSEKYAFNKGKIICSCLGGVMMNIDYLFLKCPFYI